MCTKAGARRTSPPSGRPLNRLCQQLGLSAGRANYQSEKNSGKKCAIKLNATFVSARPTSLPCTQTKATSALALISSLSQAPNLRVAVRLFVRSQSCRIRAQRRPPRFRRLGEPTRRQRRHPSAPESAVCRHQAGLATGPRRCPFGGAKISRSLTKSGRFS